MEKIRTLNLSITPQRGSNIKDVCSEAKQLADDCGVEFDFVFNGVEITTENNSIEEMIVWFTTQQ